ncbi:hypothetical protein D3C72_612490 [compost metagenome]
MRQFGSKKDATLYWTITLLAALGLAAVHILAGGLRFLHDVLRSRQLPFDGDAPVAFVLLMVLRIPAKLD